MSSNFKNALAMFQNRVNGNSSEPKKPPPPAKTQSVKPTNSSFLKAKELFQNRVDPSYKPKEEIRKPPQVIPKLNSKNFTNAKDFFQNLHKSQSENKCRTRDFHIYGRENIKKAFEFFQSRVVVNQNIQKAPEHIKKEVKRIENVLLHNDLVQSSEIFIEIGYEPSDNQNIDVKANNSNTQLPPPSKILKDLPVSPEINLDKFVIKTHTENSKIENQPPLPAYIEKKEDAEKIAKFNNYVVEHFKNDIIQASQKQNNKENIDLSFLRRRRRR